MNNVSKFTAYSKILGLFSGHAGIIAAVVALLWQGADALGLLTSKQEKLNEVLENSKGEYEEAKNKLSGVQGLLQKVYDQRVKLQDQSERDIFVQEIITKYPEISKYIDNVTMSYEDLIEVIKKLNTLTIGEAAEKAAKAAEDMLAAEKGSALEAGQSVNYDNLNNFLRRSSFSKFNKTGIESFRPSFWDLFFDKEAFGKNVSNILRDKLIEILDDAKTKGSKDLALTISQLRTEGARSLDDGIQEIIKLVTRRYEAQAEAELKQEMKAQSIANEYARKTTQSWQRVEDTLKDADENLKDFNQTVKDGLPNASKLFDSYEKLSYMLTKMGKAYTSSGEEKVFSAYTQQEAADYIGVTTTAELSDIFTKYLKESKDYNKNLAAIYIDSAKTTQERQEAFNKIFESYKTDFLTDNEFRKQKLTEVTQWLSIIEETLRTQNLNVPSTVRPASIIRADIDKQLKTKGNWTKNTKDSSLDKLEKDAGELVVSLIQDRLFKQKITGVDYKKLAQQTSFVENGKLIGPEKLAKTVNKLILDAYTVSGETGAEEFIKGEAGKNIVKAATQHFEDFNTALEKVGKNIDPAGPKFDTAAASLNKFFKDLEADINKVEIAYSEAEKALDSVLAKQQGRITATGLVFGKSSGIVQYEQNRLESMQDAQIADRLANLRAELIGYHNARAKLYNNKDFQDITSRYSAAESRYDAAIAKGNWNEAREANKIMKDLASANKKYTDEEKKLTTKITDLEKQIDELNTTIKDEEAFSKMSATEQLGLGWRAATSNYVKENKDKGIMKLAGAMSELSTQGINTLDSAMTTMFQNIADGSKKAGDAFKDFGKSVIQTLRDVAIQMAVKQGLTALFSGFTAGASSSTPSGLDPNSSAYGQLWGEYAIGGLIKGPVKNRDSVPTMLMPGEYVMKKSAVDTLGRDYLDSLNSNASAALYNASESISDSKSSTSADEATGAGGIVNVYVVGQEQQQSMTPNDVLVTITQDMLTGGQTKKLVKSIAMGSL